MNPGEGLTHPTLPLIGLPVCSYPNEGNNYFITYQSETE